MPPHAPRTALPDSASIRPLKPISKSELALLRCGRFDLHQAHEAFAGLEHKRIGPLCQVGVDLDPPDIRMHEPHPLKDVASVSGSQFVERLGQNARCDHARSDESELLTQC